MARSIIPYDRAAAVAYAHQWAYRRNPNYYDYEELGGDCTNFASQCLYTGTGVMNYTPTFGWYYIDANTLDQLEPGDFVQFRFNKSVFGHTPIIVSMGDPPTLDNTLVAAHSYDADWRPLSTYHVQDIRFLHVLGAYPQEGEEAPEPAPEPEREQPPARPPWWQPPFGRPPYWPGP